MGLLPQVILGALLIVAFALSAQQRLAIASHTGPMPARQIAYLMRVYHQSSVAYATNVVLPNGTVADPPPEWDVTSTLFKSCWDGISVVTSLNGMQTAENNAVAQELVRQSVIPPEYGLLTPVSWAIGYNGSTVSQLARVPGVGLSDGANIQSGAGAIALATGCAVSSGAVAIQTRVLP